MDNIQACPICGIQKFGNQFRWSFTGNVASEDAVYSKVCGVAARAGRDVSQCINKTGMHDKNLAWKPISQEFIEGMIEGVMAVNQQKIKIE